MNWLEVLFAQSYSASIWGFVGVLVGGLVSTTTTVVQLRHNRKLAFEQRTAEFKWQVFSEAIDALASMQSYINQMSKDQKQVPELDVKVSGALTRISLVANFELMEKFSQLQQMFGQSILELMPLKMAAIARKIDAESAQRMFDLHMAQSKEITAEIKTVTNIDLLSHLRQTQHEIQSEIQTAMSEMETANQMGGQLQLKLVNLALKHSTQLGTLVTECTLMIRRELKTPLSKKQESLLITAGQQSAAEAVTKFQDAFHKTIQDLVPEMLKQPGDKSPQDAQGK